MYKKGTKTSHAQHDTSSGVKRVDKSLSSKDREGEARTCREYNKEDKFVVPSSHTWYPGESITQRNKIGKSYDAAGKGRYMNTNKEQEKKKNIIIISGNNKLGTG